MGLTGRERKEEEESRYERDTQGDTEEAGWEVCDRMQINRNGLISIN